MSKEKRRPDQESWFEPAIDARPLFTVLATVVISFFVLIAGMLFCVFSFCAVTLADPRWFSWSERGQLFVAALVNLGICIGGVLLIVRINRKK